jgi:hypothetical protein
VVSAESERRIPDRLYAQLFHHAIVTTEYDPREVHDNGRPVYQYIRAESHDELREAAEAALGIPDNDYIGWAEYKEELRQALGKE